MDGKPNALSGFQPSLLPTVEGCWLTNAADDVVQQIPLNLSDDPNSIAQPPEQAHQQKDQRRRRSAKGKASGWIEERQGNRKRAKPTVYYVYKWDDVHRVRHTRYIPAGKLWRVQQMVEVEGQTIAQVLEFLANEAER
jgi:hypothetical protein